MTTKKSGKGPQPPLVVESVERNTSCNGKISDSQAPKKQLISQVCTSLLHTLILSWHMVLLVIPMDVGHHGESTSSDYHYYHWQ